MKIIEPSFEVFEEIGNPEVARAMMRKIETIGRTCYQSDKSMTEESSVNFIRMLIRNRHEAMLEHVSLTVKFIVDRGISHELVRHRLASFAQESTRYCNYSKGKFGSEITVVKPFYLKEDTAAYDAWYHACLQAERMYMLMLNTGKTPQEARAVLPNSLKTEIWMTADIREWRHFLKLRAQGVTGQPHPQMSEVAVPLLYCLKTCLPDLFFDIEVPVL